MNYENNLENDKRSSRDHPQNSKLMQRMTSFDYLCQGSTKDTPSMIDEQKLGSFDQFHFYL